MKTPSMVKRFSQFVELASAAALPAFLVWLLSACTMPQPEQSASTPEAGETPIVCPPDLITTNSPYESKLATRISADRFYLTAARFYGQKGIVSLCVGVDNQGLGRAILVKGTSGFMLLDGAALYAAGRALLINKFGPPPADAINEHNLWWFEISVEYAQPNEAEVPKPVPPCKNVTSDRAMFIKAMSAEFQSRSFYPYDLALLARQGLTHIALTFHQDGSLTQGEISKSSGQPIFDGAALVTAGLASVDADRPCPSPDLFPDGIEKVKLNFPINYVLR